jgi:FixJ family two-component response regulator
MDRERRHVAVVDDDESVRKALTRLLSANSFEAKSYASADDFLKSLHTGYPGCLVLDLQMPEVSGLDLQHRLQRSGIKIPTIIITADNESRVRDNCEAAGAYAFLVKPLDAPALIAAIKSAATDERKCVPSLDTSNRHQG